MTKRILILILIFLAFACGLQTHSIFAQQKTEGPTIGIADKNQNVFGVVGKVDYVEFKSRGESAVIVKDKNDEPVKVSLKALKSGATVLATYRKEAGKKGKENNVLISLSIIKPVMKPKKK